VVGAESFPLKPSRNGWLDRLCHEPSPNRSCRSGPTRRELESAKQAAIKAERPLYYRRKADPIKQAAIKAERIVARALFRAEQKAEPAIH